MALNLRRQRELRVVTQGAGNREKTREHLRDGVSVEALVTPESARYGSHESESVFLEQYAVNLEAKGAFIFAGYHQWALRGQLEVRAGSTCVASGRQTSGPR